MEVNRIILICAFSSCAVAAETQLDPSADCFSKLATESRFAPISGKMTLRAIPKSTFAMLADESFPTELERKLIADWATAVEECGPVGESYRQSNYPSQLIALVNNTKNIFLENVINLYNRKISYGQFNRRRQSIFDETRARATEIVQRLRAQQQAQQQAQEQRRQEQRRAEQAAQWAQQQNSGSAASTGGRQPTTSGALPAQSNANESTPGSSAVSDSNTAEHNDKLLVAGRLSPLHDAIGPSI